MFAVLFIFINFSNVFCQEMFSLSITKNVDNIKKKKIYKEVITWIQSQNEFTNINEESEDKITLEGFITYINPIQYKNSANLTRVYAEQTNGKLNYNLEIIFSDKDYTVKLNRIKHAPNNQWEGINFGILTTELTAPILVIDEVGEKWSNDVWVDMKKQSSDKFDLIVKAISDKVDKLKD